jgi:ABC-2 type transport system permease protein
VLYLAVLRATTRRMTTYRGATLAGLVTNSVFGLILSYVMLAVYETRSDVSGFDATDAVTFVWVSQGLIMVMGMFGDDEMADRVRTGDIALDLSRPYDFQAWWAAVHYGKALFYIWARGLPPFLVGAVALGVRLPDPTVLVAFLVAVALGVGVAFAWGFLLQLVAFWTLEVRGPVMLGWMSAIFLSGMTVPLFLFPEALLPFLRAQPFASLIQLPIEVFLGKHVGWGLLGVYTVQIFWLVALVAAGRSVLARATRRVVVQGG